MAGRRRAILWGSGILGVAALACAAAWWPGGGRGGASRPVVKIDESSPLPVLAEGLRQGEAKALAVIYQRVAAEENPKLAPLKDSEAAEWLDVLRGLRNGFLRFSGYGRASAVIAATRILDRFAVEPAPAGWVDALKPEHDLVISGLSDPDENVRIATLNEVGRIWSWTPGRSAMPVEEQTLAEWKDAFQPKVVRCLADRQPKARAAAVACLGRHPLDDAAAPALAHLDDPDTSVRQQVLVSLGARRGLLSEDAILKRLYDEPAVATLAETLLKTRGLNREQIGLGKLILNPKPELRASVIPLLRDRTDIDPEVWLLQLSRDTDEMVRLGALNALAARRSGDVDRRLAEMAATDRSAEVRRVASKLLLPGSARTAALPPLPGAPGMHLKAN